MQEFYQICLNFELNDIVDNCKIVQQLKHANVLVSVDRAVIQINDKNELSTF